MVFKIHIRHFPWQFVIGANLTAVPQTRGWWYKCRKNRHYYCHVIVEVQMARATFILSPVITSAGVKAERGANLEQSAHSIWRGVSIAPWNLNSTRKRLFFYERLLIGVVITTRSRFKARRWDRLEVLQHISWYCLSRSQNVTPLQPGSYFQFCCYHGNRDIDISCRGSWRIILKFRAFAIHWLKTLRRVQSSAVSMP
jgi:hypothetical protein